MDGKAKTALRKMPKFKINPEQITIVGDELQNKWAKGSSELEVFVHKNARKKEKQFEIRIKPIPLTIVAILESYDMETSANGRRAQIKQELEDGTAKITIKGKKASIIE